MDAMQDLIVSAWMRVKGKLEANSDELKKRLSRRKSPTFRSAAPLNPKSFHFSRPQFRPIHPTDYAIITYGISTAFSHRSAPRIPRVARRKSKVKQREIEGNSRKLKERDCRTLPLSTSPAAPPPSRCCCSAAGFPWPAPAWPGRGCNWRSPRSRKTRLRRSVVGC